MSNKIVKLTPEEKEKQDNEAYMKGRPNRLEVANYVNALLEEKYMPEIKRLISEQLGASKLGLMIIQAILVDKGICTGEDIENITKDFIEKQKAEIEKQSKELASQITE